jgi:LDH2 family malate/lactate/ureidoglycolate dehydrogenase
VRTVAVAATELEQLCTAVLTAIGMVAADAAFMAGIVVAADRAGHPSCGVRQLPGYVARWRTGRVDPAAVPVVDLDAGAVLRVDGRDAFGHLALRTVIDLACDRAGRHGIAAVALRRAGHVGRLADFCARGAARGMVVVLFANDAGGFQDVAPPGGLLPRLATNPLALGVPRSEAPHLVVDLATSVVARGRLDEERDRGAAIPAGWLTAAGALRPFGGVKGFGLALVVEALAGALTGAGTVRDTPDHDDQGVLAIAIDVARLRPLDGFTAEVDRFLAYVTDVPLEPGAAPVRVPGDTTPADRVTIARHTWEALGRVADDLGIARPRPAT